MSATVAVQGVRVSESLPAAGGAAEAADTVSERAVEQVEETAAAAVAAVAVAVVAIAAVLEIEAAARGYCSAQGWHSRWKLHLGNSKADSAAAGLSLAMKWRLEKACLQMTEQGSAME